MSSHAPNNLAFATAIVGLRPMFLDPVIEVVARRPDGAVELRFDGPDGSSLTMTIRVPPCITAMPRLEVLDIHAWFAPAHMFLHPVGPGEADMKRCFILLQFVDLCRDAVMDALGPGARHAAWWNDNAPIDRSRRN
jgi:hypothetical protein